MSNYPGTFPDADEDGRPQPPPVPSLFVDAKPSPPIEPRKWLDDPGERARLDDLAPRVVYKPGLVTRAVAAEYTDLHARNSLRRELVSLRRKIEQWATEHAAIWRDAGDDSYDPDDDDMIRTWREMVVVLDERIAAFGGVEG